MAVLYTSEKQPTLLTVCEIYGLILDTTTLFYSFKYSFSTKLNWYNENHSEFDTLRLKLYNIYFCDGCYFIRHFTRFTLVKHMHTSSFHLYIYRINKYIHIYMHTEITPNKSQRIAAANYSSNLSITICPQPKREQLHKIGNGSIIGLLWRFSGMLFSDWTIIIQWVLLINKI